MWTGFMQFNAHGSNLVRCAQRYKYNNSTSIDCVDFYKPINLYVSAFWISFFERIKSYRSFYDILELLCTRNIIRTTQEPTLSCDRWTPLLSLHRNPPSCELTREHIYEYTHTHYMVLIVFPVLDYSLRDVHKQGNYRVESLGSGPKMLVTSFEPKILQVLRPFTSNILFFKHFIHHFHT